MSFPSASASASARAEDGALPSSPTHARSAIDFLQAKQSIVGAARDRHRSRARNARFVDLGDICLSAHPTSCFPVLFWQWEVRARSCRKACLSVCLSVVSLNQPRSWLGDKSYSLARAPTTTTSSTNTTNTTKHYTIVLAHRTCGIRGPSSPDHLGCVLARYHGVLYLIPPHTSNLTFSHDPFWPAPDSLRSLEKKSRTWLAGCSWDAMHLCEGVDLSCRNLSTCLHPTAPRQEREREKK